ncbi:MAG: energy transducer TonB [Acidobacteriota bacterium]
MTDPVSEELARRSHTPWPWRSSLATAIALHLALVATVFLAPAGQRRRLVLPSVQVRLGVSLPSPAPRSAPAGSPAASARPVAPAPVKPAPERARPETPEPRKVVSPPARPAPTAPPATSRESQAPTGEAEGAGAAPAGGSVRAGGIAVGNGASTTDETFPYAYYLTRLVGMIEANWFRPPAPPGTKCRVLSRVDRSGRLLEAGVEEPSGVPSFDRAALRAVYASAPFPPLPQGFGGTVLTLHLEFGQ